MNLLLSPVLFHTLQISRALSCSVLMMIAFIIFLGEIMYCVWNSLVFSYLASMSGFVRVDCPFADDEKLKNIHVDLALLV